MSLPKTFSSGERLFASDLNDNFNNLDGRVDTVETSGYRYAGTVYYTSSGTFAKANPLGTGDIGLRAIRVKVQGAGGGGAGCRTTTAGRSSAGESGFGGGYGEAFITDISGLASSVTVTRGSGGSGGSGDNPGSDGGSSSFGSLVTAGGGKGGVERWIDRDNALAPRSLRSSYFALAGGGGTEVEFTVRGGHSGGAVGNFGGSGNYGGHVISAGDSYLGRAGAGTYNSGGSSGTNGGGGSGASTSFGVSGTVFTRNGGNGGNGIVIVECYV